LCSSYLEHSEAQKIGLEIRRKHRERYFARASSFTDWPYRERKSNLARKEGVEQNGVLDFTAT